MYRVLISIITKEDYENAISNDLETQNFQNFPARRQPRLRLVGVGPTKFNKFPTPWVTQLWYLHKHTMQVQLTDQILSIKAQCNAVYPKICFRKCSHFSPRSGKVQKIFWGREKFLLLWGGRHKKFAFSLEGGQKSFKSLFSPFTNPPPHK
jgi:hypothetical protein